MMMLECDAKRLLASVGVNVPAGTVWRRGEAAAGVKVDSYPVAVKAQVRSGGRGKQGGVVKVADRAALEAAAKKLFDIDFGGEKPDALLIEPWLAIERECYLSVAVDGRAEGYVVLYSPQGGMDIEEGAPPDGYTIVVVSGSHTINPSLYKKLSFDSVRDFAPVAMLVTGPGLLVVHPSLPARNVRELIALARAQRGGLLYASAGNGTPPHLAAELFKLMTNTQIGHVPYKGNAQAMTDLIAGQTAMSFPTIPSALPHVQTAKLRALGVTSAKRVGALPDIPAIAETVAGYDGSAWYGVLAPAGTPAAIVTRLHAELMAALRTPELKDKLVAQGLEPASYTPEEFSALIVSELAKWAKVVSAAGVKNE